MVPEKVHGVRGVDFCIGAKFPERYLVKGQLDMASCDFGKEL